LPSNEIHERHEIRGSTFCVIEELQAGSDLGQRVAVDLEEVAVEGAESLSTAVPLKIAMAFLCNEASDRKRQHGQDGRGVFTPVRERRAHDVVRVSLDERELNGLYGWIDLHAST
jgi:hypothetical protein